MTAIRSLIYFTHAPTRNLYRTAFNLTHTNIQDATDYGAVFTDRLVNGREDWRHSHRKNSVYAYMGDIIQRRYPSYNTLH